MRVALFAYVLFCGNIVASAPAPFVDGKPAIASMGKLAFAPDGTLFLGDGHQSVVFALDLGDTGSTDVTSPPRIPDIDLKLAAMLGVPARDLQIFDMAVNPRSKNIYISANRGTGDDRQPVLLRIDTSGEIAPIALDNVRHIRKELPNAFSEDQEIRRRPARNYHITALAFADNRLFVAGLSNEEFSSTLRALPYPFTDDLDAASIEIYHGAHGRFETNAPIRTFIPYALDQKPHLLAAFTCTPLVTIPLDQMGHGKHLKGKTVAELGSNNSPIDILAYQKDGKPYILLSNTNRTLMKIDPADIAAMEQGLTERVEGRYRHAGVPYIAVAAVGVQHMDTYDDENVLILQRMANGALELRPFSIQRL